MIYLIFFLSGVSALVYQVAWVKLLTVELGSTVYAVSTVLTVFMAGIALGSWWFGRRADSSGRPLLLYALMEASLGGYAVAFLAAVPLVHLAAIALEHAFHPSYRSFSLVKLGFAFALLIVPTTLMGGTLPVLARYLGRRADGRARRLALLYSCNTAGAVVGALAFAFWWILLLGVRGSILLAAAVNLLLALASLWMHRRRGAFAPLPAFSHPAEEGGPALDRERFGPRLRAVALAVAFTSGFVVLACEVLWTRLMVNFLSGNALIFATVLGAVLTGLAAGGFVATWCVGRLRRLAGLLAGVLLSGAVLLGVMVVAQPFAGPLFTAAIRSPFLAMPFVLLFLLLLLPSTLLGVTFPTLLRWVSREASSVGRDVGTLVAVNTTGAILGAVVSGYVMVELLGVNPSLLVLGVLYAAPAALLVVRRSARVAAAAVVLALVAALLVPSVRRPRYWYNGGFTQVLAIPAESTAFLEEGVSATVGVAVDGGDRHLTVNGVVVAQSRPHDLWDLLSKAHLPMLLHPDPRRVALVGLGAGVSLGAVEKYDLDRLVCVELSPEVVRACRLFADVNQRCLEDPRLELVVNDGRHFLLTTQERFDVINVDPVDPPLCTLYSRDFFQLCHDRLADGGLMVQWVPVFRLSPENVKVVVRGFLDVFEHTTVWYNGTAVLLVGSRSGPLAVNLERFLARGRDPRVQTSLHLVGNPDPLMLLAMFVGDGTAFAAAFPEPVPDNSDDRPFLEYTVLRTRRAAQERWVLDLLPRLAGPLEPHLALAPSGMVPGFSSDFARMRAVTNAFFQARVLLLDGRTAAADALLGQVVARYQVTSREQAALRNYFGVATR